MRETIRSIITTEIRHFSPIDRERISADVNRQVMDVLNAPYNKSLVSLPGEGDLGTLDFNRIVEAENVDAVRALVKQVVKDVAARAFIS